MPGKLAATHILLDPTSPPMRACSMWRPSAGASTSPATAARTGSSRTTGSRANSLSPGASPATATGALYLVVARRSENGTFGNANDGALYRSPTAPESWTKLPLPATLNGPNGPHRGSRRPAATSTSPPGPQGFSTGDTDGGVFVSEERRPELGATRYPPTSTSTTSPVDTRNARVLCLRLRVLRVAHPPTAAKPGSASGATTSKWGHRVVPDPQEPRLRIHHHLRRQRVARSRRGRPRRPRRYRRARPIDVHARRNVKLVRCDLDARCVARCAVAFGAAQPRPRPPRG